MLWYLLYPIRGTTQPPRLSTNHPVRRAFYRHGKTTAEHWLIAMLVTVAIAMAFSYPTILLVENPTAGLASYPHHVWTTAKPYLDSPEHADVEMRQVWIHGSYMRALDKDVLLSALDIQNSLVEGDSWTSFLPSLRSSTLSWGYHSPLMYWNGSRSAIEDDDNILGTINRQSSMTSSSLNVALRPASVFAGKKFDRRKLTAADALVITLINKAAGGIGDRWRDRMTSLTTGVCHNCTVFPIDGHITRHRAYEFSFTPLSAHENIALTIAYSFMALYVLLSLRRIKAFHSRFGLVVTAITQMTCSVLASVTICGMLKINLSMIPQNAFPFVVLVIGLENMFRIINAVLAYPPQMATDLRIANALGDVGPVSVAAAGQNLIILSLLSRLVSPGVAAFCAFACIATLFDAFFLLTFFVAVLMVDIRRFELSDAFAKANYLKHKRKPSPMHHRTWFDALVHGRLPFTTRMAGTAVTTTFILSLNYHFFEHKEQATSLSHLFRLIKEGPPTLGDFDTFAPMPINATLTPGQWMRMQDFDTAKEVMRLAKPGADSFIIRIFAPLIIVLPGADRTGIGDKEWTTALRSLAIHHFYPVAVAVVFIVAFVAVLMNFLLYTEHEDDPDVATPNDRALQVETIALPHRLDIIKLSGTDKGHFVSVALDRTISICLFDSASKSHRVLSLSNDNLARINWPIHNVAIDFAGDLIALHCGDEQIVIYSVTAGCLLEGTTPYPDDNPALLFEFQRLGRGSTTLHCIVLTSGGRLISIDIENKTSTTVRLTNVSLLGSTIINHANQEKNLLVATSDGNLVSHSWTGGGWHPGDPVLLPGPTDMSRFSNAVRLEQYLELGTNILVVAVARDLYFLDPASLALLRQIRLDDNDPSIGHALFGSSITCPHCGSSCPRCITLIADSDEDSDCTVITLRAAEDESATICLKKGDVSLSQSNGLHKVVQRLVKPGARCAVTSQAILGLHKPVVESHHRHTPDRITATGNTRRRRQAGANTTSVRREDPWEAYKVAANGEVERINVNLHDGGSEPDATLYVTRAGPAVPLDCQSSAVAFGNVVKIIRTSRGGSTSGRPTGRSLARLPEAKHSNGAPSSKSD